MGKKRIKTTFIYILIACLACFHSVSVNAELPLLNGLPMLFSSTSLQPSLVDIKAVDQPSLHQENDKIGIGSEERYGHGIIMDSQGIIATNQHIIENAKHIFVITNEGKVYEASVLHRSPGDLCFLKINSSDSFQSIELADASQIQIGNPAIAIGNAFLNPQRVLGGKIINVFKDKPSDNIEFLETNIGLKPGDSGGPIVNESGFLLGLIMGKQISDPSKSYAIASTRIEQEYLQYRNSILN